MASRQQQDALDQTLRGSRVSAPPRLDLLCRSQPQLQELLLCAYPFWLSLGKAAYQNIFQLVVFVGIVRWLTRDSGLTLWNLVLTYALSLSFIHEFLTGSDRFANALIVLTGIIATMHTCERGRWHGRHDVGCPYYPSPTNLSGGRGSRSLFLSSPPFQDLS